MASLTNYVYLLQMSSFAADAVSAVQHISFSRSFAVGVAFATSQKLRAYKFDITDRII